MAGNREKGNGSGSSDDADRRTCHTRDCGGQKHFRHSDVGHPAPSAGGRDQFRQQGARSGRGRFRPLGPKPPEGVLLPASAEDVAATIRWAAGRRRRFAPRGRGHSVFGRSMARAGIVGDMSRLRAIRRVEADHVVAEAGATWHEVLAATLPRGLTPPVLTDYLELSVGGTLVVGGVGGTISRYGAQSDNVLAMEVVTGKGQKVSCSAQPQRRTVRRGPRGPRPGGRHHPGDAEARSGTPAGPPIPAVLPGPAGDAEGRGACSTHDERFDAVRGAILAAPAGGWTFRLDAARYYTGSPPDDRALLGGLSDDPAMRQPSTLAYFDHLNRLAALEATLRANGQWFFPHPWLATFVGTPRSRPWSAASSPG